MIALAQRGDAEQAPDEHHLDEHHGACPGTAIVVSILQRQPLIRPLIAHDPFDFSQQVILRRKHV